MASLEAIKQLRSATGAGMMDAKRALEESGGNHDQALQLLRRKGQAKAAKRADAVTSAGLIDAYVHQGRVGAMVEISCETDFVARTDDFKIFTRDIAMQVAAAEPQYLRQGDVPAAIIEQEKALHAPELVGKPADITDKIISGKLQKFYQQVCLSEQLFIKDPDKTIGAYQAELIAKLGENIIISRFSRLELGKEQP